MCDCEVYIAGFTLYVSHYFKITEYPRVSATHCCICVTEFDTKCNAISDKWTPNVYNQISYSFQIPSGDPSLPGFRFDSNDFTIPMWIRFIKPAESTETQTLTIVQVGFKYFFEVRDLLPLECSQRQQKRVGFVSHFSSQQILVVN